VTPCTLQPNSVVAISASPPQPQPISRIVSPGFGSQLVEQAQVFLALRLCQRLLRIGAEHCGRIAHRRVEPEPVELVAEVVVGEDVALRAGARVAAQEVAQAVAQQRQPAAMHGTGELAAVFREQGQQFGRLLAVPVAIDPAFAETDVAFGQHAAEHPLVIDLQRRPLRTVAQVQGLSVGQHQAQAAAFDVLQQLDRGARRGRRGRRGGGTMAGQWKGIRSQGVHRVVSCSGAWGREWKTARFSQSCRACQWMRQTTAKRHQRLAQQRAARGGGIEGLRHAFQRGGQHAFAIEPVVELDAAVARTQIETEAVFTGDRKEGRDMEDLARRQGVCGRDGTLVGMGDEVVVAIAEGVADLRQHGAQGALRGRGRTRS
jgi:hypothetical protein